MKSWLKYFVLIFCLNIIGTLLSNIPVSWAKNEPRPYICNRSESLQAGARDCGTDPEYHLDTRTNKCYKFHTAPRDFFGALFACSAEGGHLAIINSDTESTVLKDLFAKYPYTVIWEGYLNDYAYIGFQNGNGAWRTINGQLLTEAGFSKFGPGEPNNLMSNEHCGSMDRSGLLNDMWCARLCVFICEKSPGYPVACPYY